MQQLRVPFIALLLALYLLPLLPEQVGAVSGGPLWHYAVYMFFSRQPVPSVGERFVGVRGVAISFRSPLGGGIVALWGGAAGCADHYLRYPNRGGLGCCLCLGGLSSEPLPQPQNMGRGSALCCGGGPILADQCSPAWGCPAGRMACRLGVSFLYSLGR